LGFYLFRFGSSSTHGNLIRCPLCFSPRLFTDDIKKLDKHYSYFEKITVPIFIDATQDKVKAHTYIIKDAPYGSPSDEYIKAMLKHLKFFWGQQGAGKPKLETFGITIETGTVPAVKAEKAAPVKTLESETIKKARKPRRRTAKS
jgi:hypothetical protein